MKLGYVIFYVEDVAKTLSFYESAFNLKTSYLDESNDYGQLDTGSTTLAFSSLRLMTELNKNPGYVNKRSPCCEIAFTTSNVELALQKAIDSGAELVQGVELTSWGQTTAYVNDINGFLIELCTAVEA